jgi:hypothetical protein
MNARARAIDPTTSRRRWLAASLMLFSLAALLAVQLAGAAQSGIATAAGKCIDLRQVRQPALATASVEADPALERLIALHHSATRLSAAPLPPHSGH